MKKLIFALVLFALIMQGNATKIDMEKYLIDTGDYKVYDADIVNATFDGNYTYLASFGEGAGFTIVALVEEESLNVSDLGAKHVKKPYPGHIIEYPENSTVLYRGQVNNGLFLGIWFSSMEAAIRILPQVSVIPREEYHADKSEELLAALN